MGDAPLLSALRTAPEIGRHYLVPAVRYTLFNRWRWWPVLGPVHDDYEYIGFKPLHYHLDGRFLTLAQLALFERADEGSPASSYPAGATLNAKPLCQLQSFAMDRDPQPKLPNRPTLRRMMCQRHIQPWVVGEFSDKWRLAKHCGTTPIRKANGRILCPHRKADLSQFPVEADGHVTCPLHGLRVRVAA